LTALATELEVVAEAGDPPRTATERRLAAAYATVLGVAEDQIGRLDHFFDRGGSSLSAVKLAIALKKTVSLKDVTRHPVLADLAALIDGRSGPAGRADESHAGLLQLLAGPDGAPAGTLICFPYAGGNAVNFEPMARALRDRVAVYAVELPGHDLAGETEPFAPIEQVVEQVVAEIARRGLTDVLLWGHSSGTATAVATARALEARGVPVRRVFLGAQLLGDADRRSAAIAELSGLTDADIAARLVSDGGHAALDELDAERAAHVGAAYRHDCVSAHRCFLEALDTPPTTKLAAPVTVVVAADDPSTTGFARRHGEWGLLADEVDLHELADGGHYFLRTRPAQTAEAVL
jgi:surfactin synthase thioesterase subunit